MRKVASRIEDAVVLLFGPILFLKAIVNSVGQRIHSATCSKIVYKNRPHAKGIRKIGGRPLRGGVFTALGRVGQPEDIGGVVASLLSEDNRWVNAQRIEASGGMFL